MSKSEPTDDETVMAMMAASLLEQGRQIHATTLVVIVLIFGFAFTGVATDTLDATVAVLCLCALVAALAELWLAIRVAFDAALFRAVAGGKADLQRLDIAFQQLGLVSGEKSGRPIALRIKGGLALLRLQGGCLLMAVLPLVAAMAVVVARKAGLFS